MRDTLRSTFRRVLRLENRRTQVRPGRLDHIPDFTSAILGNARMITVYVPAGYDDHPERHYPVLYMQDAQNLFEPERAFVPGQHWRLKEAADAAISARRAAPMIIVGVDHAGAARMDEYTPTRDEEKGGGGHAADTLRMLVEELLPRIDSSYRTRAGESAVGGSSLGGLFSLFAALEAPEVFGRAAVMSPSVWWNGRAILNRIDEFHHEVRPRLWVDIGLREGNEAVSDARLLRERLRAHGWRESDLRYVEDRRADHSEAAWAARVGQALEFLFPPI